MTFKAILDEIENNLNKILQEMSLDSVSFTVEPAKPGFGDVSSNVSFLLAKPLKKSPKDIADILSEKYQKQIHTLVLRVESHPSGYLNFFADWAKLNQLVLSESFLPEFGDVDIGNQSTVVVEHTSVNPKQSIAYWSCSKYHYR